MVGEDAELAVLVEGVEQRPSYAGVDEGRRARTELQPLRWFHAVSGDAELAVGPITVQIIPSSSCSNAQDRRGPCRSHFFGHNGTFLQRNFGKV